MRDKIDPDHYYDIMSETTYHIVAKIRGDAILDGEFSNQLSVLTRPGKVVLGDKTMLKSGSAEL